MRSPGEPRGLGRLFGQVGVVSVSVKPSGVLTVKRTSVVPRPVAVSHGSSLVRGLQTLGRLIRYVSSSSDVTPKHSTRVVSHVGKELRHFVYTFGECQKIEGMGNKLRGFTTPD